VKVVNKTIFAGFVALMLVSKITCANAQQFGTAEEARAMLDRAISALKTDEDKALTEFNDPDDKQFHDRDLYVVCFNMSDGKITAYLGPALLGVDIRTLSLNDESRSNSLRRALAMRAAASPTLNRTECGVWQMSALQPKADRLRHIRTQDGPALVSNCYFSATDELFG
jgi:hypothetical protein